MKKYETIEELIADPLFQKNVDKSLSELISQLKRRPEPKPGYHYKRDWYDRMYSENALNSLFFLKNIQQIWAKKSNLNSEYRAIIQHVCDIALHRTLREYAEQDAKQKEEEAATSAEKE